MNKILDYLIESKKILIVQADSLAKDIANPILLGPRASQIFRRLINDMLIVSLIMAILSPTAFFLSFPFSIILPVIPLVLLGSSFVVTRIWRFIVGYAISRELPSLLSYSLPYSAGPKYLADVLAYSPSEYFPWFSWEADRLRFLLELGYDPVSALKELASTTPSQKLRDILLDYIHSHELGSPRSQVTLRLLERAVAETRSQWKSYIDLGKGAIEALTAIVMASIILAPLSLLSGGSGIGLALLATLLAPVFTTLLIVTRPSLGEINIGPTYAFTALLISMISAAITYIVGPVYSMILLLVFGLLYEYTYRVYQRRENRALTALREVATGAKYGRFLERELSEAIPVASRTIKALIEALAYAGKIGVAEAISNILRVVESAKESVASAKGQGLILTGISTVISGVSIYIINAIVGISSNATMLGLDVSGLEQLNNVILAISPMVPLPGTILWRGKIPSLTPSLMSLVIAYLVLILG
ncbi:MAG: hypothetical protein F7B19_06515 [Desulfurococcales archaeon]|nr:hypothetical protein [Desulfurococcales archaeon]